MAKLEINIDEKWPVFSLDAPRKEDGPFTIELTEDQYKDYLWTVYKYHQWQIKIQVYYESSQRELSKSVCGYRFPEGSEIGEHKFNRIRDDASQA